MSLISSFAVSLLVLLPMVAFGAERRLPPLNDGAVVRGPGRFRHDGELKVQGKVRLEHLTLDLRGPIQVAGGSSLELDDVHLLVSDPAGAPNGTSGLQCLGPAKVVIRNSTMAPVGSAHPMWRLQGELDVEGFATQNSEFHLEHVTARIDRLKIFELEISHESVVAAQDLDLVFLSTHSGDNDHLTFADIPTGRPFSATLALGSGAGARIRNARLQFFLLYLHGSSQASLTHMGRVQLAMFPQCTGRMQLPEGQTGTGEPVLVPQPGSSDCPFRFSLNDVNVDTWDVYAGGAANLSFTRSRIDELAANGHAKIQVRDSVLYADWLAAAGDAELDIADSTVGALSLAAERPDLATSQVRLGGRSRSLFSRVRFDCGIFADEQAHAKIERSVKAPKYIRRSGDAVVQTDSARVRKIEDHR